MLHSKNVFANISQHFWRHFWSRSRDFYTDSKGILVHFWYFAVLFCWILRKWFLRAVQISLSCTLVKYVISPSKILFRNSTKVWNLRNFKFIWRRTKSKLIKRDFMGSNWTIQWRIELRNVILLHRWKSLEKK